MPKMMTKCTTCGAILAVDSASHKEVCPYCGWSFTVVPVKGAVSPGAQPGPLKKIFPSAEGSAVSTVSWTEEKIIRKPSGS